MKLIQQIQQLPVNLVLYIYEHRIRYKADLSNEFINRKIISCCKVIPITINKEVVGIVGSLANKYGIKFPISFKYCRTYKKFNFDNQNKGVIKRPSVS